MQIPIFSNIKLAVFLLIYNSLLLLFITGYLLSKLLKINYQDNLKILSQRLTINLRFKKKISKKNVIWIHGASIGEITNALKVIRKLHKQLSNHHIIITSTSYSVAKLISNLDIEKKKLSFQLLPFDLKFLARKFIKFWKPSIVIWNEQDIWPNTFLVLAKNKDLRKVLIQGRISSRSYKLWSILGKDLFVKLFNSFESIYLQNVESLDRFQKLGITWAKYRGNLKNIVDQTSEDEKISKNNIILKLRREISNLQSLQYISSHGQDEEVIMFLIESYKKKILTKKLKVLIAPRHPNSIMSLKKKLSRADISFLEISKLLKEDTTKLKNAKVIIWDILGSINSFLKFESKICIIGGSFGTKLGGHNPFEPLSYNKIVIFGSDMKNFPEALKLVDNERVYQVSNYKNLPRVIDLAFKSKIKIGQNMFSNNQLLDELSELILS